jgi:hypothetical protein
MLQVLREALEKLLKRQLQQKRQRPSQRFCPSIAEETEANDFLERSRVRLLPTTTGAISFFTAGRLDVAATGETE